jgi:hypothetical protein
MVIPEYEVPVWGENYAVLNKGGPLPLWSGKGPVPSRSKGIRSTPVG